MVIVPLTAMTRNRLKFLLRYTTPQVTSVHNIISIICPIQNEGPTNLRTIWFQLEDMFQLIVTPQGNEKVTIQLKDTPTKVYAIGARLFLSKVPLQVLQN